MSKRDVFIAVVVVAALAVVQSPLMVPLALVLLGRWAYLDATARRVRKPIAWVIMTPMRPSGQRALRDKPGQPVGRGRALGGDRADGPS